MNASHYIHRTPYDGLVTTAHTADGIAWVDYQREPTARGVARLAGLPA